MPTNIAWCDETWNPVAGCRKVSAGCDHCYAIKDAHRLAASPHPATSNLYTDLTTVLNGRLNWTGIFREIPERLHQPLRWTRPRRIFVNSMSDLFGEGISDGFIFRVLDVIERAPRHQFQVLTKRPERMRDLLTECFRQTPPPNLWAGTSVEDQKAADDRIPELLETPAAVRFLSAEPLLGPIDLCRVGPRTSPHHDYRTGERLTPREKDTTPRLDWVIAGGESGPEARPCDLDWLRSLRDQCREAGTPYFLKQAGSTLARRNAWKHPKGGDMSEWPSDLRIREYPR